MEVSWDMCVHIAITLTSVGLTLAWERLRQHSKTIDAISTQTQYLTSMTYWSMMGLFRRMDKLEKEMHVIQVDGPEEDHDSHENKEPGDPPSTNVYTWDFEPNPFIPTFTNNYPWTTQDAPCTTTYYVPDSVSDNDDGSPEDNVGEIECSDFTDEDNGNDESEDGTDGTDGEIDEITRDDVVDMVGGDNRGTDDTW